MNPEIGIDKAGALTKVKVTDPGPPEGPRREAVATIPYLDICIPALI